jgi:hypothetical protein
LCHGVRRVGRSFGFVWGNAKKYVLWDNAAARCLYTMTALRQARRAAAARWLMGMSCGQIRAMIRRLPVRNKSRDGT